MTLNLDKNRDSLISSWKEVVDEKVDTDWVLYGYDGQTFDLNLVGKGDRGLEELADEFNSGKIQYALARVKIKEKNVEKIVLINWQGEGAPLSRKGMCANHIGIIRSFFKGIHVTMNARTDEEVDPDLIIQNVSKAIAGEGVMVSSNIDTDTPVGPVGTCYKKTNPREEINSLAKDEFWRKEEQEEERRKRDEQNKYRKFSQNEVKLLRRESQDYFNEASTEPLKMNNVNGQAKSTTPVINGNGSVNGKMNGSTNGSNGFTNGSANSSPVPPKEMAAASMAAVKASTPLKNSTSSDLVRQRIKSFDNGAPPPVNGTKDGDKGVNGSSNGSNEGESLSVSKRRQLFESGGASNTTSTVVRRNPSLEIKEAQKQLAAAPTPPPPTVAVSPPPVSVPPVMSDNVPIESTSNGVAEEKVIVGCGRSVSPQAPQQPPSLPVVTPVEPSLPIIPTTKSVIRPVESPARSPVPPVPSSPARASPVPLAPSPQPILTTAPPGFEDSIEGQPESLEQTETITIEITPEMGLCARALYDYQAGDDTEISFDPGEIITNIERIDEGWWEGLGGNGVYGLFPANYVELLN